MKVKVLEAMASGVPVVTTPAGAEGIEPTDGVVVLEEPAALASAAAELLTDERHGASVGPRLGRTSSAVTRRGPRRSPSSSSTAEWRDARAVGRPASTTRSGRAERRGGSSSRPDVVDEVPTATMIVGVQVDVPAAQIL